MDLGQEILKAMQILIDKSVEKVTKADLEGVVVEVNANYYAVLINGTNYKIKNGTNINFKVGERCLVHCINGDFTKKIIIAKL